MTMPLAIRPAEVHVWVARLEMAGPRSDVPVNLLTPDELERAARYEFDKDRQRFVAGRGVLRQLLERYLHQDARQLGFEYGPQGKPRLAREQNPEELRFNVSHSAEIVAMAFALGREVGIDVEYIRPLEDMNQLARQVFAPDEMTTWRDRPAETRVEEFFSRWTRTEALAKAIGLGWVMPGPGGDRPVTEIARRPGEPAWDIRSLELDPEYAAAVAIEGAGATLQSFEWEMPSGRQQDWRAKLH